MNIRNLLFITASFVLTSLISSCQETIEERCVRECREYTKTKCPVPCDKYTTIDSLVFDADSHTLIHYYTLKAAADSAGMISVENARNALLQETKNSTKIRLYKEHGYSFRYIYHSQRNPETVLLDILLKKEDYQ